MKRTFNRMASATSKVAGKPITFLVAVAIILMWGLSGPVFAFSDTWQLIINTGTTIITFLMVFLIQNTQNRDTMAIHAKLDEILHCMEGARQDLEHIEDQDEDKILEVRR